MENYLQGLRTLDDLRTKANLTHQQKIGLRCYDDFLDRMPRSEAGEIEKVVSTLIYIIKRERASETTSTQNTERIIIILIH